MLFNYYSFLEVEDNIYLTYNNNGWKEVKSLTKQDFISLGIKNFDKINSLTIRELEKLGYANFKLVSILINN